MSRNLWITFSVPTNQGSAQGDIVCGVPEGRLVDASFMGGLKNEIAEMVSAQMASESQAAKVTGKAILLAVIPLEEPMPTQRYRTPSQSIWHPAVGHRRFR